MKRYVAALLVISSLTACPDKNKDDAPAGTASREGEHKPSECPTGLEGRYGVSGAAPEDITTILMVNGQLTVRNSEAGDLPVNGSVHIDKADGSSNTIICRADTLEMTTVETDGSSAFAIISKVSGGLKVDVTSSNGESDSVLLHRLGDAPAEGTPASPSQPSQPSQPSVEITCLGGNSYSYSFTVNGCATGRHTLCSEAELCSALKNEALNNGCARQQRNEKFALLCE